MSPVRDESSTNQCVATSAFLQNFTNQKRQGNDACIEQIIKRSKKGSKIQVLFSIFIFEVMFQSVTFRIWTVEVGLLSSGAWR